ncbi:hypothetical protein DFH09DRAFT_532903 [Mycena vulgaris]|nr:hypothetical protein DFH09DRAFT_532903 [Mycena vulgaris]
MGELDADSVIEIPKGVTAACEKFASRLPLIQGRLERDEDAKFVQMPLKMRQYLRVPVPAHRKALTRLYLSSHTLAIEILRYTERYRERTRERSDFAVSATWSATKRVPGRHLPPGSRSTTYLDLYRRVPSRVGAVPEL